RRRVGGSRRRARRGRDPPHLDGPRRHPRRLRSRAHRAGCRGGACAGHRLGRCRRARALRRSLCPHRRRGGPRRVDLPLRRGRGRPAQGGARCARNRRAATHGGRMSEVAFDERGLVPAIVQDAATGTVLMLAYMDKEALDATLRTREVHFHSRSRGRLWKKGETSGNVLHLVDIALDCDADALLVKAHPAGPTCHTGAATCFSPQSDMDLGRFLTELAATLIERKRDLPAGSYSAELFRGGTEAIAAKLVEEATETAAALRGEGRARTISELTDLLYVMLVLATDIGASPDEIRPSLEAKRAAAPARRVQREGR